MKLDFPALLGPKMSVMGLSGIVCVSAKALKLPTFSAVRMRPPMLYASAAIRSALGGGRLRSFACCSNSASNSFMCASRHVAVS